MEKITILIPCYNEDENIPLVLEAIKNTNTMSLSVSWVLIDNGSTDNTKKVLEAAELPDNVSVLTVEINQGYGYGLQQGIKSVKEGLVGWIHADLQMPFSCLEDFFSDMITSNDFTACRKAHRINRPFFDRFFTAGQSVVDSVIFGQKMNDISATPIILPRDTLGHDVDVNLLPNDFSIDLAVYHKALEEGNRVIRIDVPVGEREKKASSWNSGLKSRIKQSARIVKDSVKIKKHQKIL